MSFVSASVFCCSLLGLCLMARPAAGGTVYSDRKDVGNWSLWIHYMGGEDADLTIATSPPAGSVRPSISLECRDGRPVEGAVTVRIDSAQPPKPSVQVTVDFGKDNGAAMHFTTSIDKHGNARIAGLGTVLEVSLRLRNAGRLSITIDDAEASFDVSGFQEIERDFLQICMTTN